MASRAACRGYISRCNLVGKPREIASKQFREFIAERMPPETVNDPFRDVYAATNIPIRVPTHFMGRDDALAAIEKGLGRYRAGSRSRHCTDCAA